MTQVQNYPAIDLATFIKVHARIIVIPWLVLGNLGLWVQAFKHFRWANYIHMACLSIVTLLSVVSGFMAALFFGVPNSINSLHTGIGMTVIILFFIQTVGGFATFFIQKGSNINPNTVLIFNKIHRYLGLVLYGFMMVPILIPSSKSDLNIFYSSLLICVVSYGIFLLYKILRKKKQKLT